MTVTLADMKRAAAYGRLAARRGRPVTTCPYEANGDHDQRVQAFWFVVAYVQAGGRVPVDYGDGAPDSTGRPATVAVQTSRGSIPVTIVRRSHHG